MKRYRVTLTAVCLVVSMLQCVSIAAETFTLSNSALATTWQTGERGLQLLRIEDELSGRTIEDIGETFAIALENGGKIAASECRVVGHPRMLAIRGRQEVTVSLLSPDKKMQIHWRGVLGDSANHLRQTVMLDAIDEQMPIETITLLDLNCREANVCGTVKGSPIVAGNMFLAYEHPNATSVVQEDGGQKHVTCSLVRKMPLAPNQPLTQSSVIGVAPAGQMRRAFGQYIEAERPRAYKPFLHYNSWYDIAWADRKMNEGQCLNVIEAFGHELTKKRGVALDSFVFDDGWDDNKTLWGFHEGFPNGFTPLMAAARKYDSAVGVWLSPWGGYGQAKRERLQYGKTQGFEVNDNGFSLAGPKYYARFRDVCAEMIRKYDVNYFKFDGVGIGNGRDGADEKFLPDIEGQLRLCTELRKIRPDVYLSITTGTWPSPYWLFHGDSIWRNGRDCGFYGDGTMRQKWITYRDMITYRMVVKRGPLYPLNSLMVQGICYAQLGTATRMANDLKDIVDEIWMLFGSGTQLQELYVTPSMMEPPMWDALAKAATWSRDHADVLVDVHWIGGDPGEGQVYGYASWSPRKGILILRNPSDTKAEFNIDVRDAFELPAGAAERYRIVDPREPKATRSALILRAGQQHSFELEPFETLVLEAIPIQ